ncbi:MAG: DUF4180 domain-containing protein [Clostridiales bacterium]|jgi:hypothetical protein|nr:DUF4180 domain-containing protein [Clostridiales bacterium]
MNIKTNGPIAVVQSDEPVITDSPSALDLMATVKYETNCDSIIINKSAVADNFFVLSNGIAGEILQKFVNYHVRLAIVGDFSRYTSKPLRDFICECNKGNHIYFVDSVDEAVRKLNTR